MATEWRNKRGKSQWQPTLPSGERLWYRFLWGELDGAKWGDREHSDAPPVLHSRRRAERVERREQKRRDREEWDETFEEVQ